MIVTSTETFGLDNVYGRLRRHTTFMSGNRLSEVALAGAREAQYHITNDMLESKRGIQWPSSPGRPMPVRSSSPAETPASQSGELLDSMKASKMTSVGRAGRAKLEASGKHAWWMEFGFTTRDGNFHIRPFMRPGIIKYRDEIIGAMKGKMRSMRRF